MMESSATSRRADSTREACVVRVGRIPPTVVSPTLKSSAYNVYNTAIQFGYALGSGRSSIRGLISTPAPILAPFLQLNLDPPAPLASPPAAFRDPPNALPLQLLGRVV